MLELQTRNAEVRVLLHCDSTASYSAMIERASANNIRCDVCSRTLKNIASEEK